MHATVEKSAPKPAKAEAVNVDTVTLKKRSQTIAMMGLPTARCGRPPVKRKHQRTAYNCSDGCTPPHGYGTPLVRPPPHRVIGERCASYTPYVRAGPSRNRRRPRSRPPTRSPSAFPKGNRPPPPLTRTRGTRPSASGAATLQRIPGSPLGPPRPSLPAGHPQNCPRVTPALPASLKFGAPGGVVRTARVAHRLAGRGAGCGRSIGRACGAGKGGVLPRPWRSAGEATRGKTARSDADGVGRSRRGSHPGFAPTAASQTLRGPWEGLGRHVGKGGGSGRRGRAVSLTWALGSVERGPGRCC